jgi:acetolactate synthase I/II/III large subunit
MAYRRTERVVRRLAQRRAAIALRNPDFAAYARAFGRYGATVDKTADFAGAFADTVKSGEPAILHLKVDPEAITPTTTPTALREKAMAARGG